MASIIGDAGSPLSMTSLQAAVAGGGQAIVDDDARPPKRTKSSKGQMSSVTDVCQARNPVPFYGRAFMGAR